MTGLIDRLKGGDRRSIGPADECAREVEQDPSLLIELVAALDDPDPLVRMRAADTIEKATKEHWDLLAPFKTALLNVVALQEQPEVRWHIAQMLPRLELTPGELELAAGILMSYFHDQSRIVRASALEALARLAGDDPKLQKLLDDELEQAATSDSPALRARARRITKVLLDARAKRRSA